MFPFGLVYEDPLIWPSDRCVKNSNLHGHTGPAFRESFVDGRPLTYLCPQAFVKWPRGLLDWDCDHAPEYIESRLGTIGSLILHEITHWTNLTDSIGVARIVDYGTIWDWVQGTWTRDPRAQYPFQGYGSYNCWQMKVTVRSEMVRNSDSYARFALESLWASPSLLVSPNSADSSQCLRCGQWGCGATLVKGSIPACGLRDPIPDSWDGEMG